MNKTTRALAALIGTLALTALTAPAASAVTANWVQGDGGLTPSTPSGLTFKAKVSPTNIVTATCSPQSIAWQGATATTGTTQGVGTGGLLGFGLQAGCVGPNGGQTIVVLSNLGKPLAAEKSGSVFSLRGTDSAMMYMSGAGGYYQSNSGRVQPQYSVPWTNGSIANPSRATFNDTQIGVTSTGVPITLTGTVTLVRDGGLISLN